MSSTPLVRSAWPTVRLGEIAEVKLGKMLDRAKLLELSAKAGRDLQAALVSVRSRGHPSAFLQVLADSEKSVRRDQVSFKILPC